MKGLDNGSGGFDLVKTDGATVLKAGLARTQWYNVWIVADNAADTFDLYLSEAEGPAGEATLPTPEDLVESNIPFGVATAEPLTGMIFTCPAGTGQSTRTYIDEIYWDGDLGLGTPTKARNPIPVDEATDVPRDVALSWQPGEFAAPTNGHKVYFGESFDYVNDATGVVVQTAASYTPPRLDFGKTYYWRVDEVHAPPTSHIEFKGDVWSFTTEPFAYPIADVNATASSSLPTTAPENTVNSSGLDADDLHSAGQTDMWLSANDPLGAWIQYEFDKVHKLHEMWVWNFNQVIEPIVGFGRDLLLEGQQGQYGRDPHDMGR